MSDNKKIKPKLYRAQVIRLKRLLHMKYTPSEIAEVLEVNIDTIYRTYLSAGCPHEKDNKGRIWIIGTAFKTWAEEYLAERKIKKNSPMAENEGWCVVCNKRVIMVSPKIVYSAGNREILQSVCPNCGKKVNRARGIK